MAYEAKKNHKHKWNRPYQVIFFGKLEEKKLYFRECFICQILDEVPQDKRRCKFKKVKQLPFFYDSDKLKDRDQIIH